MLAAYHHHLHELAHMIVRAKAANPTLLVVWRQTTHQLLLDDAGAPELSLAASLREGAKLCGLGNRSKQLRLQPRAYPGTHPSAITALNAAAREILPNPYLSQPLPLPLPLPLALTLPLTLPLGARDPISARRDHLGGARTHDPQVTGLGLGLGVRG